MLHKPCIDNYQRKAVEETKAMFPQLKQRVQDALTQLEVQLVRHHVFTFVYSTKYV
jgi:hypothetical protein